MIFFCCDSKDETMKDFNCAVTKTDKGLCIEITSDDETKRAELHKKAESYKDCCGTSDKSSCC